MSELLKINVNEHTEKKNNLTYLSWAWAWAEVLKIDPNATWYPMYFHADGAEKSVLLNIGDGTAMVGVTVTIQGVLRQCLLPVMDHKNKAIPAPNAFQVNTAIMRCMTKAVSMFGLGLYIYAGEDLPEGDEPPKSEVDKPEKLSDKVPNFPKVADLVLADNDALEPEIRNELSELAETIKEQFPKSGPKRAAEHIALQKLDSIQELYLSTLLPTPMRNAIKTASHALNQKATA